MNKVIALLLGLFVSNSNTMFGEEKVDNSVLLEIGRVINADVKSFSIGLAAGGKKVLKIKKNKGDVTTFDLGAFEKLTILVMKGGGLGSLPRVENGPAGILIRVIASGSDNDGVFGVTYQIPAESIRNSQTMGSDKDVVFERVDYGADDIDLGSLKIWIEG